MATAPPPRTLVIACGALARELLAVKERHGLDGLTVECLPAALHNRPKEIPEAVRARIRRARGDVRADAGRVDADASHVAELADDDLPDLTDPRGDGDDPGGDGREYDEILVGYADCGTGGLLDRVCEEEGVERLPGAHCYQFFATAPRFDELQDHALGSFYLTDFLVKHFDRLIWRGLGIERHPELLPMYFGNYTRLVYLAQTDDPELVSLAERAAERLGLELTIERTGYGELESTVVEFMGRRPADTNGAPG